MDVQDIDPGRGLAGGHHWLSLIIQHTPALLARLLWRLGGATAAAAASDTAVTAAAAFGRLVLPLVILQPQVRVFYGEQDCNPDSSTNET